MSRETDSARLEVRLARAKESIEQGDQERALGELWRAEALARGDIEALREILDFATSSGQWVGLSPLVETLRHDIGAATGSLPTAPRKRRQLSFLQAFLLSVAGALAGALVGGEIGSAIAPKGDPNALLDLSGLDYIGYCVMIGFFVGAAAMTLVGSWLPRLLEMAMDHRGAELPKGWE
jgi:hypothetical protein